MQILCFEADRFGSVSEALKEGGRLTALSILFKVGSRGYGFPPVVIVTVIMGCDALAWNYTQRSVVFSINVYVFTLCYIEPLFAVNGCARIRMLID